MALPPIVSHTIPSPGVPGARPASHLTRSRSSLSSSLGSSLPELSRSISQSPSPSPSPSSSPEPEEVGSTGLLPTAEASLDWTPEGVPTEAPVVPNDDLLDPDFVCAVPEDGVYVCSKINTASRSRTTWTIDARTSAFLSYLPTNPAADQNDTAPVPYSNKPSIDGNWLCTSSYDYSTSRWSLDLFQLEAALAHDRLDSPLDGTGTLPRRGVYAPILTVPLPEILVGRYGIKPPLSNFGVVMLRYPYVVV